MSTLRQPAVLYRAVRPVAMRWQRWSNPRSSAVGRAAAGGRLDARCQDAGGSAFGNQPRDGHHRGHHQKRQAVSA